MAKAVAKGKKKKQISDTNTLLRKRYEYARGIYEIQDEGTQRLMQHMMNKAIEMNRVDGEIGEMMAMYIVVRLFVACAKWDIRLAKFKLPKKRCADCGGKA